MPNLSALQALDLPSLVMRRALQVALLAVAVALGVAIVRAHRDIDEEARAAQALAQVMAQLSSLQDLDDTQAAATLAAALQAASLRHLELAVRDADGRLLAGTPGAPKAVAAHAADAADAAEAVAWRVDRGPRAPWQVSLAPSRSSERREAWADLASLIAVLLIGSATMLGVMGWNVRRALQPLAPMLVVIGRIERGEPQAVNDLPPMPIRELQTVAAALRRLGGALQTAQEQRRLLGRKMLTLQEDERTRLAAELHDEFGQRLTALRVDAAWLERRLAGQNDLLPVVHGMVTHCEAIQADIRGLLARLQPLGPRGSGRPLGETPQRLRAMLQALVDGWRRDGGPAVTLHFELPDAPGITLPRAVALALYRISQEALTNVARHAQATRAGLSVRGVWPDVDPASAVPHRRTIDWQVCDDGVGLSDAAAALQRGNGLAGIKQRVWALGGDLSIAAAQAGSGSPGLCLRATLAWDPAADSAATDETGRPGLPGEEPPA